MPKLPRGQGEVGGSHWSKMVIYGLGGCECKSDIGGFSLIFVGSWETFQKNWAREFWKKSNFVILNWIVEKIPPFQVFLLFVFVFPCNLQKSQHEKPWPDGKSPALEAISCGLSPTGVKFCLSYTFFCLFVLSRGPRGSNTTGNGYPTALCGAPGTPLFKISRKSWIYPQKMVWRKLAEVS